MAKNSIPDRLARHLNPPTEREGAAPAPAGRVYGYARVSTVMQADEGESLDVQQRTISRLRHDARPGGRARVRRARRVAVASRSATGRRARRSWPSCSPATW